MKGQIFKIYSDSYYVKSGKEIFICTIREVLKKQKTSVVTGDYVEFDGNVIQEILPRKSFIKRPAVANIDQIVIVSALKQPDLDFHQLNRYISLAKYYNIKVILCFNKEDLNQDNDLQEKIEKIYNPLGFDIIFTSATQKTGVNNVHKLLSGKLSALCGNSGVGKSSLINSINPDINLKTGAVSDKLCRGTHTTRHSEIIELDSDTCVIDTPGFSNVKFDFILPKDIDKLFDEIYKYKSNCKYSDCLHINETGCEVLNHIKEIDPTRYESYKEFLKEAFEFKDKIKYNGIKEETYHKIHNNKSVAKISDKKRQASRNTQKQKLYKEIEENEHK